MVCAGIRNLTLNTEQLKCDSQAEANTEKENEMSSTAIQTQEETALAIPSDLHITRAPKEILDAAREAAVALKEVISHKHKKVIFNGEQYLQYEDWQTIGGFFSCSVATGDAELVEIDGVPGFKAKARVIDTNGIEVSAAEAYCMKDEINWKLKPFFQLASMAQTRAGAKALRNKFAWVAVLAGYSPTPAEEMVESQEAPSDVPNCPECGGQMWDNRATKKGRQPDYKCKDKSCGKAVWLNSEETNRKVLVQSVADAFKLLNQLGDDPQWTRNSANQFVAEKFEGVDGVDALTEPQLEELLKLLSSRVKVDLIAQIQSEYKEKEIKAELDKNWRGASLESLTVDALEQLLTDMVPF
jgi:hypothetical protein